MKKLVIGISEGSRYINYENWIKDESRLEILNLNLKLSYHFNNLKDLEKCDGFILTGGEDVNPELYHRRDFMAYIDPKNMNEQRDEFEWKIIRHTEEYRKPLLGICRGLQLVNVYFGGSLLPDIPLFGKISLETRLEQALNPFS